MSRGWGEVVEGNLRGGTMSFPFQDGGASPSSVYHRPWITRGDSPTVTVTTATISPGIARALRV